MKPKIIVVWDVNNGMALPDGQVISKVGSLIENSCSVVYIGTENILNEFRVRQKRGQIELYFVPPEKADLPLDELDEYLISNGRFTEAHSFFSSNYLARRQLMELLSPSSST
jgi:hypothetical protein